MNALQQAKITILAFLVCLNVAFIFETTVRLKVLDLGVQDMRLELAKCQYNP